MYKTSARHFDAYSSSFLFHDTHSEYAREPGGYRKLIDETDEGERQSQPSVTGITP